MQDNFVRNPEYFEDGVEIDEDEYEEALRNSLEEIMEYDTRWEGYYARPQGFTVTYFDNKGVEHDVKVNPLS